VGRALSPVAARIAKRYLARGDFLEQIT